MKNLKVNSIWLMSLTVIVGAVCVDTINAKQNYNSSTKKTAVAKKVTPKRTAAQRQRMAVQTAPEVLQAAEDHIITVDEQAILPGQSLDPINNAVIEQQPDGSVVQTITSTKIEGDKLVTTKESWTWKDYVTALAAVAGIGATAALLYNQDAVSQYANQSYQNFNNYMYGSADSASNNNAIEESLTPNPKGASPDSEEVAANGGGNVAPADVAPADNDTPGQIEALSDNADNEQNSVAKWAAENPGATLAGTTFALGAGAYAAKRGIKLPNFNSAGMVLTEEASVARALHTQNEARKVPFSSGNHTMVSQRATIQPEDIAAMNSRTTNQRMRDAYAPDSFSAYEPNIQARLKSINENTTKAATSPRVGYKGANGQNADLINEANYASSGPQVQNSIDARLQAQAIARQKAAEQAQLTTAQQAQLAAGQLGIAGGVTAGVAGIGAGVNAAQNYYNNDQEGSSMGVTEALVLE